MTCSPESCAFCGETLSSERYEVADLGQDGFACADCARTVELDAELEDALFGP